MTVLFEHDGCKLLYHRNQYSFSTSMYSNYFGYQDKFDVISWALRYSDWMDTKWKWAGHVRFILGYFSEEEVAMVVLSRL